MTHSLFNMRLKSIVSRDPRSRIGFGFRGITDVRNAEVDISAFKGLQVRLPVGRVAGAKVAGLVRME